MFKLQTVWEQEAKSDQIREVYCRPGKRERQIATFTNFEDAQMAAHVIEELITAGHFVCCDVVKI